MKYHDTKNTTTRENKVESSVAGREVLDHYEDAPGNDTD